MASVLSFMSCALTFVRGLWFPAMMSASRPRPRAMRLSHCSGCEVEHLGDLGVVEPGEISEYDRRLEFLGELRERIIDIDAGGDGLAGIERRATTEGLICDVLVIREAGLRATTPATELVETGVGGDPVRPGRERRAAVEALESLDDGDQRLLGGVERAASFPASRRQIA